MNTRHFSSVFLFFLRGRCLSRLVDSTAWFSVEPRVRQPSKLCSATCSSSTYTGSLGILMGLCDFCLTIPLGPGVFLFIARRQYCRAKSRGSLFKEGMNPYQLVAGRDKVGWRLLNWFMELKICCFLSLLSLFRCLKEEVPKNPWTMGIKEGK